MAEAKTPKAKVKKVEDTITLGDVAVAINGLAVEITSLKKEIEELKNRQVVVAAQPYPVYNPGGAGPVSPTFPFNPSYPYTTCGNGSVSATGKADDVCTGM